MPFRRIHRYAVTVSFCLLRMLFINAPTFTFSSCHYGYRSHLESAPCLVSLSFRRMRKPSHHGEENNIHVPTSFPSRPLFTLIGYCSSNCHSEIRRSLKKAPLFLKAPVFLCCSTAEVRHGYLSPVFLAGCVVTEGLRTSSKN